MTLDLNRPAKPVLCLLMAASLAAGAAPVAAQQVARPPQNDVKIAPQDATQPFTADDLDSAVLGIPEGYMLIEGDIVVPDDFLDGTRGTYRPALWPAGVVPYQFDANVSPENQARALAAMAEWEARANVDFRPRAGDPHYIHIFSGSGNWSSVGRNGGPQSVSIDDWDYRFVIAHELAHALGLWHEQSRIDRDQYVQINWSNIPADKQHNFQIQPGSGSVGPYDFDSIMHYGRCDFTICGVCQPSCQTITVKPPYAAQWQNAIGQRNHLSSGDAATMAALYGGVPDCNGNQLRDSHDIATGFSSDCNANGTPDECEIAQGAGDCNANGLLDICELVDPDSCCTTGHGAGCTVQTIQQCVCSLDPYCCNVTWDNFCVGEVGDFGCGSCTAADCNGNGILDECDIANGSADCDANGVPDVCQPDCNANGIADPCDISSQFSTDANANGIPDDCDPDCNSNGVPDDLDIAWALSLDLNTNGTPDDCEPDCNGNVVPDDLDIAVGTSADCNATNVPDECEITAGTSNDCNTNGSPDECDIDCDGNGTPDECDIAAGSGADANDNGTLDACETIYVDADQIALPGDGQSWATAYRFLQDGLARADAVRANGYAGTIQVWVAVGSYRPDQGAGQTPGSRTATFALRDHVEIYGGFGGTEVALEERPGDPDLLTADPLTDSIMTGDLAANDAADFGNYGDNSLHVVTGSSVNSSAVVDGFTIRGGNANGSPGDHPDSNGGGVYCGGGSARIRRCALLSNLAGNRGGGAFHFSQSEAAYTDCVIAENRAIFRGAGGGLFAGDSDLVLTGCFFFQNESIVTTTGSLGGGALFAEAGADLTLNDCLFEGNTTIGQNPTSGGGGAIFFRSNISTLTNCTFSSNIAPDGSGGAVAVTGGTNTLSGCTFTGNSAYHGGALRRFDSAGTLHLDSCAFVDNRATGTSPTVGSAGAAYLGTGTNAIRNCRFEANSAKTSGALWVEHNASLEVSGTRFLGNLATGGAAGAVTSTSGAVSAYQNCLFSGNSTTTDGGAFFCNDDSVTRVQNCSFGRHFAVSGGVFYVDTSGGAATLTMRDSIVWNDNTAPNGSQIFNVPGTMVSVQNSDVYGGFAGANNIAADPLFVDPLGANGLVGDEDDDLRLAEFSPCIDSGGPGGTSGIGASLLFDGVNDLVRSDVTGFPSGAAPRTLEAWIYRTSPALEQGIATYGTDINGARFGLILSSNCPNKLYFFGYNADACSGNDVPLFQWTHVAVTYDPNDLQPLKLYLNGQLDFAGAPSPTASLSTQLDPATGFQIGARSDSPAYKWGGAIDEVRLWDVARSQTQIQDGMFAAMTGAEADLVGYWPFTDIRDAQFVDDFSPLANHGTLGFNASAGADEPQWIPYVTDLAGNERIADVPWMPLPGVVSARVDMGAFEHQPDCDSNGVRDDADLLADALLDCNTNSVIDACDLAFMISTDIDADNAPDECVDPRFYCAWTGGGGNTSWDNPVNWLPMRRPNNLPGNNPPELYHATIGPAAAYTVSGPSPAAIIETLDIGANSGTSILNLTTGLTVNDAAAIESGGRVSLNANNATLGGGNVAIAPGGQLRTNGAGNDTMRLLANIENSGEIRLGLAQTLNCLGDRFANEPAGVITILTNADLFVDSPTVAQRGVISASGGAGVLFNAAPLVNSNGGAITLVGATLACPDGVHNLAGGLISGVGGQIDADIYNEGTIEFEGDLTINGDLTSLPGGIVTASGDFEITGTVHDFTASGGDIVLSAGGGQGKLTGRSLNVTELGQVTIDGSADVTLSNVLSVRSGGTFTSSGNSDAIITGSALHVGDPNAIGGYVLLGDLMTATFNEVSIVDGPCAGGPRGCSPPELQVVDDAGLLINGPITLGTEAAMLVSSSVPVQLAGNFVNQSRARYRFRLEDGALRLTGTAMTFEVGGEDRGPYNSGLLNNFAIGQLEVASSAAVQFDDAFDNDDLPQQACGEALYVDSLVLRAGSAITLNNVRIYYRQLIDEGGTVQANGCGGLAAITEVVGDYDGDGDVDEADFLVLLDCLGGPETTPAPSVPLTVDDCLNAFDFDGDMDVDLRDFAVFATEFSG